MTDIVIPYDPQARQIAFHECNADEVMYGGAAGGGKSEAILFDALANAFDYEGCSIIVFRRTFPDLKRSLIQRSLQSFPKELGKYNQSDKKWYFTNGSTIEFAYWDDDSNYMNYQGAEYDFIYWDELTQFKEGWYIYMLSRLRGSKKIHRQVKSATNPGGIGHAWVKGRFIDEAIPEEVRKFPLTEAEKRAGVKRSLTRCFIPASVYDNPALLEKDPQYLARLMSLNETERRALLEGDWDIFAGQYFREWRKDKHTCRPFAIPDHWRRYVSMDWGFNDPCAIYWHAADEDGHYYTYREWRKNQTPASDVAKIIKELSAGEKVRYYVGSPDIWQKRGQGDIIHGQSIGETFQNNGVYFQKADNNRLLGWSHMREMMEESPDGKPYWMIFDTCHELIKEIPALIHDDKKVEDVSDQVSDHSSESCRYFLMSRPRPTKAKKEEPSIIQKHKAKLVKKTKRHIGRVV